VKRKATFFRSSTNGKKAFYIDDENSASIIEFLKSSSAYRKKFEYILKLLLEHERPPRDLYDKENIEKGCEHITAMKPAKGKNNPRIYCQQYKDSEREVYVIVASELLEKKKSEGLTNKEKTIIRRVASYQYELSDE
jgi:hypothetical protein